MHERPCRFLRYCCERSNHVRSPDSLVSFSDLSNVKIFGILIAEAYIRQRHDRRNSSVSAVTPMFSARDALFKRI